MTDVFAVLIFISCNVSVIKSSKDPANCHRFKFLSHLFAKFRVFSSTAREHDLELVALLWTNQSRVILVNCVKCLRKVQG